MSPISPSATAAPSAEASRTRIPPPSIRCSRSSTTQRSRCRGRRAAATFRRNSYSVAALTTNLEPDEIVYEIEYPILSSHNGWGFEEVARRFGDFALGCIAVSLRTTRWTDLDARVAVMGVDETPRRLREAEAVLRDRQARPAVFKRFSETVRTAVSPPSDIHVSSEYRRALIGSLAERVTAAAWTRAAGAAQ